MKLWKDNYRRGQYRKKKQNLTLSQLRYQKPHHSFEKRPRLRPGPHWCCRTRVSPHVGIFGTSRGEVCQFLTPSFSGLDPLRTRRFLAVSHATKPHTFRRTEKRWCWSADHRGPSLRLKGASINIQFLDVRFFWKVQSLCSFIPTSATLYMPQYEWFLTSSTSPSAIERINRSIFEDRIQDAAIS